MQTQAIEKIKAEMEQNRNNAYVQAVGGMLLQYMDSDPASAERILTEGKTISGSLAEMQKEARKKQVGNCAVLTDQEGFEIVLRYYGIEAVPEIQPKPVPKTKAVPVTVIAKPSTDFSVSLDDLLSEL